MYSEEDEIDFLLKILLVGNSGVGKTNLLSRFIRNSFLEDTKNTIGVDFSATNHIINSYQVKT